MDFLDEVAADNKPVEKQITFNGKTGAVYCKRITAGQKLSLVRGKKYQWNMGEGAAQTVEVDLEENERSQQFVVLYCICTADGAQRFKRIDDVQKLDAGLIAELYRVANEVNKSAGDADPGEA